MHSISELVDNQSDNTVISTGTALYMERKILVTGGCGFIGSHLCVTLLQEGYHPVILDNLSNSSAQVVERIEELGNGKVTFIEGDILKTKDLDRAFSQNRFLATIHLAGLKSVSESTEDPIRYYQNNVIGTLNLCSAMRDSETYNLIYSSSATVYDNNHESPLTEESPTAPSSPYGHSKLMSETVLESLAKSDNRWSIAILRYFNPVGAHPSGKIGESPTSTPNNLMPYITQVAIGKRPFIRVFGNDYPTSDGTGIRDYIHIMDLSQAHLCALNWSLRTSGIGKFNIGTGAGHSVKEVIKAFEDACGFKLPHKILPRRPGDVASCYANTSHAQKQLAWKPTKTLIDMCKDAWNWQHLNPNGYLD